MDALAAGEVRPRPPRLLADEPSVAALPEPKDPALVGRAETAAVASVRARARPVELPLQRPGVGDAVVDSGSLFSLLLGYLDGANQPRPLR